ncbi:sulfurtransferase TusA family protein [Halalkalibacter sp. AB-rgal2]|uniref:Rhodanese-like domain protein n=1 Tax=Halalkalibacter hemicellulosilyticusJCM 9152 TaxID=1236971 RepID=W4QLG0_9BACI|nr:sulfurtransferase TusA family protein [Halalkalibacter hemicellulosilyticus]GAE32945.1 rhodanese-like domain protein [Halalkalibacter hemicellulosilyticusJCM 9152]
MEMVKFDQQVNAKGLACPMPIVRTKKAMSDLQPGKVLEVQATDKGSTADIKAWAQSMRHQYLGTVEEGDVLKHYLRKATEEEEKKYPHVVNNEELQAKLVNNENILVLDVRELTEYAFNHIPEAKSIPLGELDNRLNELSTDKDIYVVCRTGSRSDLAAQTLTEAGFKKVINVVPGMSEWSYPTDSLSK